MKSEMIERKYISKINNNFYDFDNCKVNYIDLLLNGNVYDYNLNENDYCKRCNNKEKLCNVYLKRLRSNLLDWNEERKGIGKIRKEKEDDIKVIKLVNDIKLKGYNSKEMSKLKLKSKINRSIEIKKSKYYNKMLSERLLKLNEEELNEIEKISIIENKIDRRKRKDNDLKERLSKMSIEEFNEIKELFVEGN